MRFNTKTTLQFALAFTVVATLTACGGGGSSSTPAPAATTTPAAPVSTLVTSVPAATYSADLMAAYNLINSERQRCGFGLLTQNAKLDQAAQAHANYQVTNNVASHDETPGAPGFFGASLGDRMAAAGYSPGNGAEVITYNFTPTSSVRDLLASIYHAKALLEGYRDVGIGYAKGSKLASFVVDLGTTVRVNLQASGADVVQTYPCEGTEGVSARFTGESPSPLPGRNLSTAPVGQPILVMGAELSKVTLSAVNVVNLSTGSPVPMLPPVSKANDPFPGLLSSNVAYAFPDVALSPNTKYQVNLTGQINGATSFSRSFVFTTGAGPL